MTLAQLIAPVASATALNVVLLGGAWRATQIEKQSGAAPWYLGAGIVAYGLAAAGFVYGYGGHEIASPLGIFAMVAISEVLGAAFAFGLFHAIYRRDVQPLGQRIFEIGVSIFMLAMMFVGMFV